VHNRRLCRKSFSSIQQKANKRSCKARLEKNRSSGYFSAASTSVAVDGGFGKEALEKKTPLSTKSREVSTQTEANDVDVPKSPLVKPCRLSRSAKTVLREFCWRHDSYADIKSPPARPSSPCSFNGEETEGDRPTHGA